jgi:geranylgeranyl diphosphate synthase type II
MIGGQTEDIRGERLPSALKLTQYIHERKTAALFQTACRMGAIAGGAGDEAIDRLGWYGLSLGFAFQIADDLLDLTSTPEIMGKGVGKDASADKQTYPQCVGVEESRRVARRRVEEAVTLMAEWDSEADDLRALARFALYRNY